jgi:hypothetical protein
MVRMAALALIDTGSGHDPIWSGFSRFVPRLSWHDTFLLRELPADASYAVAKSLPQAGGDAQLVMEAHRSPRARVILDTEAWRNQRQPTDRGRLFRALGPSVSLAAQLQPEALVAGSPAALIRYAMAFADAETVRGADAILTPSHLAGGHGTPGRDGELRLTEAAVAVYRRERVTERADQPMPLLSGITVDGTDLGTGAVAVALARSYSAIGADGFWVQFAHITEGSPPDVVARCAEFLFALQELSDSRVFAVDVKNLIWPMMAAGLFGGCIGIGERETWAGPEPDGRDRRALKPTVVHPELLRNFVAAGPDARRAFMEYPCECDAHEPERPPLDRASIRTHALRVRLIMAATITSAGAAAAVESWLREAGWAAAELGLDQPPAAAYRAVFSARESWRQAA